CYTCAKDDHKQKQADLNQDMAALLRPPLPPADGETPSAEAAVDAAEREKEIQWRLVLPMVNEAAKLLAEGVTDSTDVIDLATVLGTGLAPFRGGLAHFADTTGIDVIVTKLEEMSAKYGPRFAPAPMLRELRASHHSLREV